MARSDGRNILITRFSALGDVAMSIPVVYDICRTYPDCQFVMVTKRSVAGMFINTPDNLTVVGVDLDNYKGLGGITRLFKDLRHTYRFDTIVDLHDVTRTKILRLLSRIAGIRVSAIDKKRSDRKKLINHTAGSPLPVLENTFTRYRSAFEKAGLSTSGKFSTIFDGTDADISEITDIIGTGKPAGERWIAVAPFAAHPGKIYPEHLMRKVLELMAADKNVKLFVFGAGDHEREAIARMTDGLPGIISMAEKRIGLARELKLLRLMDAALTMDSGNMHLAAIAGIKVISIWGQTHPNCGFYGWQQDRSRAVESGDTCRPCSVFGNKPCKFGDYRCLAGITPQEVVARIKQTIEEEP